MLMSEWSCQEAIFAREEKTTMPNRRAHSMSASSSSDENSNSSDERSRHRRSASDEESFDVKPKNLKMPELLDPNRFEDFTGLPLLQVGDITKDDEFWIVQCPKNMDAHLLLNKKINLGGSSKIKAELDNGTVVKLEAHSEEVSQSLMTCLLQGSTKLQIVQLPVQGKVLITDKVETPEIDYEYFTNLKTKPDKVPQPPDLKLRHPLFGSEYEDYLSASPRKSKKKKKEIHSEVNTNMDSPKKKKRKHEVEEESLATPPSKKRVKEEVTFSPLASSTQMPESKKKKRKLEEDSEMLATPPAKKKIKQEVFTPSYNEDESMNDTLSTSSSKKKKHKKSKHRDEDD